MGSPRAPRRLELVASRPRLERPDDRIDAVAMATAMMNGYGERGEGEEKGREEFGEVLLRLVVMVMVVVVVTAVPRLSAKPRRIFRVIDWCNDRATCERSLPWAGYDIQTTDRPLDDCVTTAA